MIKPTSDDFFEARTWLEAHGEITVAWGHLNAAIDDLVKLIAGSRAPRTAPTCVCGHNWEHHAAGGGGCFVATYSQVPLYCCCTKFEQPRPNESRKCEAVALSNPSQPCLLADGHAGAHVYSESLRTMPDGPEKERLSNEAARPVWCDHYPPHYTLGECQACRAAKPTMPNGERVDAVLRQARAENDELRLKNRELHERAQRAESLSARRAVRWMRDTYPQNEHAREWADELERVFLKTECGACGLTVLQEGSVILRNDGSVRCNSCWKKDCAASGSEYRPAPRQDEPRPGGGSRATIPGPARGWQKCDHPNRCEHCISLDHAYVASSPEQGGRTYLAQVVAVDLDATHMPAVTLRFHTGSIDARSIAGLIITGKSARVILPAGYDSPER